MFFGLELHDSDAELGVTATGQGDGGGRGSGKRRRRLRSGITGEDEGESQGENGVSEGSGQCRGVASRRRHAVQARQAARELRGELGVRGRAPLCLPGERKQVAGTGQHSAGPASGLPGGLRQVSGQVVSSLSLFSNCFSFLFLQVCFEFGFETNSIYFASDNIFRS